MTSIAARVPSPVRRIWHSLLVALGFVSLALGIVGTVVPLIPTTPLLLLAAFLFARSSDRFYGWLLSNRLFGETISAYRDGLGLPLRQKLVTLAILWVTVLTTSVFAIPLWWVRVLLAGIAAGVTIYLMSLPTRRPAASHSTCTIQHSPFSNQDDPNVEC